jgi:hypothetical protein
MEMPEHKDLERFIHEQLQKLPQREAPEDLVQNVLASIRARQNLPWWKQPFTEWPRGIQNIFFALLAAAFSAAAYFAAKPAEVVTENMLTEKAGLLSWAGRTLGTIVDAAVLALQSIPLQWMAVIAAVFFLMYAACVCAGLALYRITSKTASYRAV